MDGPQGPPSDIARGDLISGGPRGMIISFGKCMQYLFLLLLLLVVCRSLSEDNAGERASSAGSPRLAAAAGSPGADAADKAATTAEAAAQEREGGMSSIRGDSRERGPSGSPERGPPSSLPLHSRVGDLRRRLQSKRAEPSAQQQ